MTIPLTNVANAQTIEVTLNNVNGSTNVTIPMRVLVGDVNGNGAVNATDIGLTKSRSGQPVGPTTFMLRCDRGREHQHDRCVAGESVRRNGATVSFEP